MKKCSIIKKIEDGIHTFEIFQRVNGYHYVSNIINDLYEIAKVRGDSNVIKRLYKDREGINERFEVNYDFPKGVSMSIVKSYKGQLCNIRYKVNPSTLKDSCFIPEKVYAPSPNSSIVQDAMLKVFQEFNNPTKDKEGRKKHDSWKMDYNSLTISRIDLTWNIYFDKSINVAEVIRLFKKSYHKKNYNVMRFNDERDRYSFRITSLDYSQTITVYDKVYEIRNHRKNADYKYDDFNILRIEISLKRSAFIRIVKNNLSVRDMTYDQVLYYVYAHRYEMLHKYLWILFRCSGRHMPYDKAKSIILNCKYSMEYKERMLYFMDKVSNSDTYFTAMMKTRNKFDISESAINRLEGKFNALNVNPITFPKDSKIRSLDSFHRIIPKDSDDYSELRTIEFYSSLNKKLRLICELMQ